MTGLETIIVMLHSCISNMQVYIEIEPLESTDKYNKDLQKMT